MSMSERKWNLFSFGANRNQPEKADSLQMIQNLKSSGFFKFSDAKYDYSKPYINKDSRTPYVMFGSDNLYPNILLDMYYTSPIHSAIVEFKTKAALGDGLVFTAKQNSLENEIKIKTLESKFNRTFLKKLIKEYLIHNRIFFVVEKSKTFHLLGAEKVRTNREQDLYYVNDDWRKNRNFQEFKCFDPLVPDSNPRILGFEAQTPGVDIYCVPSYAVAANWIWLDGQIAYFQKQNMINSVNPSVIIKLFEKFPNKEAAQNYIDQFNESFSSARNAGKPMVVTALSKETAPEITIADSNRLDKAFAAVQENIVKNVSYAHLLDPVLLGISTAGSLGNTEQMNTAFKIFNAVSNESLQDDLEDILKQLLTAIGYDDIKVSIKRKDYLLETVEPL